MNKKILWVTVILLCIIITIIVILNIKVVQFYFIDNNGDSEISYMRVMLLPSERSQALKDIINDYLNYAKNNYVNGELLTYMKLKKVKLVRQMCLLDLILQNTGNAEFSSFSEDRSLIMLLKTIKSYDKDIEVFKIRGLENYFKHIDTRFPINLNGNNLVITGDIDEN